VGIRVVDDLEVTCYSVSNPSVKDTVSVSGSFAWKLLDDGASASIPEEGQSLSSPLSTPDERDLNVVPTCQQLDSCIKEHTSTLSMSLKQALADEEKYRRQFEIYTSEQQRRIQPANEIMAGSEFRPVNLNEASMESAASKSDEHSLKSSTAELTLHDLRLAKQDAWRIKEKMTTMRLELFEQITQTKHLSNLLGKHMKSTSPNVGNVMLSMMCPNCEETVQVTCPPPAVN